MQVFFDTATERLNVINTLQRLIDTVRERSHSTAEVDNLKKAMLVVKGAPVVDFEQRGTVAN